MPPTAVTTVPASRAVSLPPFPLAPAPAVPPPVTVPDDGSGSAADSGVGGKRKRSSPDRYDGELKRTRATDSVSEFGAVLGALNEQLLAKAKRVQELEQLLANARGAQTALDTMVVDHGLVSERNRVLEQELKKAKASLVAKTKEGEARAAKLRALQDKHEQVHNLLRAGMLMLSKTTTTSTTTGSPPPPPSTTRPNYHRVDLLSKWRRVYNAVMVGMEKDPTVKTSTVTNDAHSDYKETSVVVIPIEEMRRLLPKSFAPLRDQFLRDKVTQGELVRACRRNLTKRLYTKTLRNRHDVLDHYRAKFAGKQDSFRLMPSKFWKNVWDWTFR